MESSKEALQQAVTNGSPKELEQAILDLCKAYKNASLSENPFSVVQDGIILVRSLEPVWNKLPRAKTSRLLRELLDSFPAAQSPVSPGSDSGNLGKATEAQLKLVEELAAWAERDARVYLRQSLECRLASLRLACGMYTEALKTVASLLVQLKRLEDLLGLAEVHLLECRIHFHLRNGPKARAALTAARSAANSVHVPPILQAALDMQSAYVHGEEGDFQTAFSYFTEALDSYASLNDSKRATLAVKYLIFCKIMSDRVDEVDSVIGSKAASPFARDLKTGELDHQVAAMVAVGKAYEQRSLAAFEAALALHPVDLGGDMLIHAHFQTLYDRLMVSNLLAVVVPYSRVPLKHVADALSLPVNVIESKLSVMILDKQLKGIIDQNESCLIMRENTHSLSLQLADDPAISNAIDAIKSLQNVVDCLTKHTIVN